MTDSYMKEVAAADQAAADAYLYRHMLGVAESLGYSSITQAIAASLWHNTDESQPEEGTPVICHDGIMPYVGYMWFNDAGNEEWIQNAEPIKRPVKWMSFPPDNPRNLTYNDRPVTAEPVMPSEIGLLVNSITGNSKRDPAAVALRCLGELVETCLAVGNSGSRISAEVADTLFNQALKLQTEQTTVFPSQLQGVASFDEAVKELADTKLVLADLQYTLGASSLSVDRAARAKYDRLVATPRSGFAVSADTFYLKKKHLGDSTPATGDTSEQ